MNIGNKKVTSVTQLLNYNGSKNVLVNEIFKLNSENILELFFIHFAWYAFLCIPFIYVVLLVSDSDTFPLLPVIEYSFYFYVIEFFLCILSGFFVYLIFPDDKGSAYFKLLTFDIRDSLMIFSYIQIIRMFIFICAIFTVPYTTLWLLRQIIICIFDMFFSFISIVYLFQSRSSLKEIMVYYNDDNRISSIDSLELDFNWYFRFTIRISIFFYAMLITFFILDISAVIISVV